MAAIISSPHAGPRCGGGIATRLEARMPMDPRVGQDHDSMWSEQVVPYTCPSPRMCLGAECIRQRRNKQPPCPNRSPYRWHSKYWPTTPTHTRRRLTWRRRATNKARCLRCAHRSRRSSIVPWELRGQRLPLDVLLAATRLALRLTPPQVFIPVDCDVAASAVGRWLNDSRHDVLLPLAPRPG